jgi:hypothetical protein
MIDAGSGNRQGCNRYGGRALAVGQVRLADLFADGFNDVLQVGG